MPATLFSVQAVPSKVGVPSEDQNPCANSNEDDLVRVKTKYTFLELDNFEANHGIELPVAYRKRLMRQGVGGKLASLSPLEEWCQPFLETDLPPDFLRSSFPHVAAWNRSSSMNSAHSETVDFLDPIFFTGSMRIVNRGGEGYFLMIVSGPCRGEIWCDYRALDGSGIYPLIRFGKRVTIDQYLSLGFPLNMLWGPALQVGT